MQFMILLAFFGMTVGSFLILHIKPMEFVMDINRMMTIQKRITMHDKVRTAKGKKKEKGIHRLIRETRAELAMTNQSDRFPILCLMSMLLGMAGAMTAFFTGNIFLVPVLMFGFALFPFWYTKFSSIRLKKQINLELETALSIITTSYMRSESILTAIEENITYINTPVQEVFRCFLLQTKLINSNIKLALANMKDYINNEVFREWVEAMIMCQDDKDLKTTLTPIVSKLSDIRIVTGELDYLLYEPLKEFITMAILVVANIPLIYFLNKDWFFSLVGSIAGKFILAVSFVAIFISLGAVIRLTKPVDYRR